MTINFVCEVQVDNVVFDCLYEVTPGQKQTWTDPAIPPEIEIKNIRIGFVDVTNLLKDEVVDQILSTLEEDVHEDLFDFENDLKDEQRSTYDH
jgi:hypothetical protein